jgi:hypothetical protein
VIDGNIEIVTLLKTNLVYFDEILNRLNNIEESKEESSELKEDNKEESSDLKEDSKEESYEINATVLM